MPQVMRRGADSGGSRAQITEIRLDSSLSPGYLHGMFLRPLTILFWSFLMAATVSSGPVAAQGAAGIGLACLPDSAESAALCGQLRDVIDSDHTTGVVTLTSPEGLEGYPKAVRLHIEQFRADSLSAHLEWRAPGQDWQRGITMTLDTMDTTITPSLAGQFLRDLWSHSRTGL